MKQFYVQTGKAGEAMSTVAVESKHAPMRHHKLGRMWSASGYGKRIPSEWLVKFNGKWRRVYVICYSNSGTAYIGRHGTDSFMIVSEYDV